MDSLYELQEIIIHFLTNPLIYWVIFLSLIIARKRKRIEIDLFQLQATRNLLEWHRTIPASLLACLVLSFITLNFGMVISFEIIIFICILSIILTFLFHFKYLSAAYTIGLTYLLLVPSIMNHYENSIAILASLTFLIGFFLVFEGLLLKGTRNKDSAPELSKTKRGGLVGELRVNRVSFIPFFIFIPGGSITPLLPIWPTLTIGGEAYAIALVPFVIGFNYLFTGKLPQTGMRTIANRLIALGGIVVVLSITSFFLPIISLPVVLIALIGKAIIQYSAYLREKRAAHIFLDKKNRVSVLWVIAGSPAAKAGLQIGDTILKVNHHDVHSIEAFYDFIQPDEVPDGDFLHIHILRANNQQQIVNGSQLLLHKEASGLILL